ncbi:hypothetical protein EJ08DRAFT_591198 [Tothia fuscella]|uniref:Autophagy-related protein 11 n=1 Tax=Tothia fuscella TaxID=1048955 RepID=A0A9P4NPZ2_9PEZI|nr:hypothetical protein EJ08DRAFT_591198 [Tothia fuscella]
MSLRIFIIPSGESIESTAPPPTSLDGLRQWVAKATSIAQQNQILLTNKGKHVKLQTLLTETELYLYDREFFTPASAKDQAPHSPIPDTWTPSEFPTELQNSNSLKSWQRLFIERRDWANDILNKCKSLCRTAEEYIQRRATIEKGLRVASATHEQHFKNLEAKHSEAKNWLDDISTEIAQPWEVELNKLTAIPAHPGFSKFFGVSDTGKRKASVGSAGGGTTLASFIDRQGTEKAAADSKAELKKFSTALEGCYKSFQDSTLEYEELMKDLSTSQTRSIRDDPEEPSKQLQEVQAIANKVASDCEHVLGLKNDPKSLAQSSKIALLNTRNFLPTLRDIAKEMDDLVRHSIEEKNALVDRAYKNLLSISNIEGTVSTIGRTIADLQISEEGANAIARVGVSSRLPLVYGTLLLEAIRRKEWIEKMKQDSATLAEELAGYQDEEQKRRKRWLKSNNDVLTDVADGKVLGVEINLSREDYTWPDVTREDLEKYIKALQGISGMDATLDTLSQMIRDADRPTKQQVKRAKAFKMGSIHEAGLGKGSLLLRGEDEMRVLREVNMKLEDETKGYKSRIRKLEDVLHRQSQMKSLSMANGSQANPFEPSTPTEADRGHPLPSPRNAQAEFSRPSSVASRRFSSNLPQEDKGLARKVLQLEAELTAEKDARAALVKDILARQESDQNVQDQIEEANSTKKDLMENMEAQQREFGEERRSLEDEISKYKLKFEEMEDELENLVGSRENERTGTDARLQSLVNELEKARAEAAEDVQQAEERVANVEDDLRRRDEIDAERQLSLKGLYQILSPDQAVPNDFNELLVELEGIAQRSTDHTRDIAQAVALAKSENDNLQSLIDGHKGVAEALQAKSEAQEADVRNAQEELETEKAKASSLTAELENERNHLKNLRAKFAQGETGSGELKTRLDEEEAKVLSIASKLAESQSHVNILDVELSSLQEKYRRLQNLHEANSSRLQQRSERAKSVTQRLYAQNDRINRLLESLGFFVTYEEDAMVVQRKPSRSGASTLLMDASRISTPPPTKRLLDDLSDLSPLLWMEKDSPDDEAAKFQEFVDKIDKFNLDIFSETVTKRMKDIEHTARKWQKEAKGYRDRAHRAQSDAHEKIAFRSFKEGDLALFLPTRNQATRPWAAFNIGAPHYFLREQDTHRLHGRDWLVARITKITERVVDLSKTFATARGNMEDSESGISFDDDNPFDLSDGLRWFLMEAQEEKIGAPSTPGLGKATVSAANVDAKGSIRVSSSKKKPSDAVDEASKALSRSLDSRRSSTGSKKSAQQVPVGLGVSKVTSTEALRSSESPDRTGRSPGGHGPSHLRTTSDASSMFQQQQQQQVGLTDSGEPAKTNAQVQEEVRKDLLFGP